MKSSTLHRAGLTREKMSMIENVKPQNYDNFSSDINQYIKFQKKPELDVLWRDFEKSVQSKSRTKAPIVYAGIGFVMGLLFALGIAVIITLSSFSDIKQNAEIQDRAIKEKVEAPASVGVVPASENENSNVTTTGLEEKYTVKAGDTLDKIAYRFYGKYDKEKIDEIMRLNNIKDETTIQIGQIIIVPLN